MVNDHDDEVIARVGDSPARGATPAETSPQLTSPQLIVLGVLGGVYLFYTIGWVVGVARILGGQPPVAGDPGAILFDVMFTIGGLLAILAAPVWIGVTLALTRDRPFRSRLLWLLLGAAVLVPWFFVRGSWASM